MYCNLSFFQLDELFNRLYRISKQGGFESRDRAELPTKEKKTIMKSLAAME